MIKMPFFAILFLFAINSAIYPYLISVQVLKNPTTGQTVVLYGDYHGDADDNLKIHESALQSSQMLKRMYNAANYSFENKDSIKILIEGIDEQDIAGYLFKENPLIRLSLLKKYKFGIYNWTHKINSLHLSEQIINMDVRRKLKNIPYNSLREEIGIITTSLQQKLRKCDAESRSNFTNAYQSWIDFTKFRALKTLNTLPQSMDDQTRDLPLNNLLDINTILEILSDQKTSKFIVLAGDSHVKQIILALKQEGYAVEYESESMTYGDIEKSTKDDLEDYRNNKINSLLQLKDWQPFSDYLFRKPHYGTEFKQISPQDFNWIDNHLPHELQINDQTDSHEMPIPLPKLKNYFKASVIGITALAGICTAVTIKYLWGLL